MTTRTLAALVGLLLVALAYPAAVQADEATNRNLIERGNAALREAQRHHVEGRLGDARRYANRAAALFGQVEAQRRADPEAAFMLVQAAVFAGDAKAANRWLETYVTRSAYGERDPNVHYARGLVLLLLEQRSAAALESLEQMRRMARGASDRGRDTLYYQALMAESGRLIQSGAAKKAIPLLQKAGRMAIRLRDRRKELAARSNAGIAWQISGSFEEARQIFDRLATEDPRNLVWPFHLGIALTSLERSEDAVAAFGRVVTALEADARPGTAQPFLQEAYLRRGRLRRTLAAGETDEAKRAKRFQAARQDFETFVGLVPRDARGPGALGALLFEVLGEPYDALGHLEKAHALDPVCDAALAMLVQIASTHPAPEGESAEAWARRRAAWQKDLEANRETRARAREARARERLDGSDGC